MGLRDAAARRLVARGIAQWSPDEVTVAAVAAQVAAGGWFVCEVDRDVAGTLRLDCVEGNARLRRCYRERGFTEVGRRDFDGAWQGPTSPQLSPSARERARRSVTSGLPVTSGQLRRG